MNSSIRVRVCSFSGNINLINGGDKGKKLGVIIGASVGAAVLLIVTIISCILMCKVKKNNKMGKTSGLLICYSLNKNILVCLCIMILIFVLV